MKLMVASDIHGSATYARQMVDAFHREGADRLLLLGDLLYHGARNELPEGYDTRAVFPMLNALGERILCVRGNCDSEVDQMVLSFPIRADYCVLWAGGRTIYATHGHLFGPDAPPPLVPGDILLCGHTHVPAFEQRPGFLHVNPGSVSLPKDGSQRGYMLLSEQTLYHKNLLGDPIAQYAL